MVRIRVHIVVLHQDAVVNCYLAKPYLIPDLYEFMSLRISSVLTLR